MSMTGVSSTLPEDLTQAFEHAIQTELALKGYDLSCAVTMFRSKDGKTEKVGEEADEEDMFACEICDGLVKESDSTCPHCGVFEDEEEEEPASAPPRRGGPPGPSKSGPPGPKKSGGPPGPGKGGPPGPKKSRGPPGPSKGGPPGPKKSGGPPGPKKSGGPPGPSKGGPPGPKKSPSRRSQERRRTRWSTWSEEGGPPGGPKKGGPGGPLAQARAVRPAVPKRRPWRSSWSEERRPSRWPKKGGPGGPPGPKKGGSLPEAHAAGHKMSKWGSSMANPDFDGISFLDLATISGRCCVCD